jgi:hypothetical protein
MPQMIVTGSGDKLNTIKKRFRSLGVSFEMIPEENYPEKTEEQRKQELEEFKSAEENTSPAAPDKKKKKGFLGLGS